MSPPNGRPEEGSLPLRPTARSAKGAQQSPSNGRPEEGSLPLRPTARSAKGAQQSPSNGRPEEGSLPPGGTARSAKGAHHTSVPLLEVEGLSTHFFMQRGMVKAVDDVSFTVSKGEVLGILGESGCGKTVTGHSIVSLVDHPGRIVSGRIAFDGRDLRASSTEAWRQLRGSRIAIIFQNTMMVLNPVLRVDLQMMETILAHREISHALARERARVALVRAGFAFPDECLASYPHHFSTGMRQRVAFTIALLNDPELIIADDPTAGLDATIRGQILYALQMHISETGAAVIWMTRDVALIADIADRIGVMYAGRIVEEGLIADVLGNPMHPYTQALLESVPSQMRRGGRLKPLQGMAPCLAELPSGCAFRSRCERAMDACVGAPSMRVLGDLARGQALRCHNPIPRVSVDR